MAQECPESTTPDQDRENASQAFEEGQRLFEAGNHTQALRLFDCSYSLYPHRDTLFNIGRCHEELDTFDEAARSYRLYIERYPEAPDVADIEARVLNIEQRLESSEAEASSPSEEASQHRENEEPPITRMSTPRIMAWVTLGLGLAMGLPGGGLLIGAGSVHSNFDTSLNNPSVSDFEVNDMAARGRTFTTAGWSLFGVGAASLLTSIILFAAFDSVETVEDSQSRIRPRRIALNFGLLDGNRGCAVLLSGTL